MAMIDVKMPDGTVVKNVPEGTDPEQILQMYSSYSAKNKPKFEPQEDTVYSPEGIAQITPQTQGAPTGAAGTAAKVMADLAGAPIRAGLSLAKPVTNVMGWMGMKEPGQAVKQMDQGLKAQGPEFMGVQGPIGSVASLGGDIFGANKILGGLEKLAAPIKTAAPMVKPAIEALQKSKLSQAVGGGAVLGALGSEGTPLDVIEQGGIGAGVGAVAHGALKGAGAIADPALKQLEKIKAAGLDTKEFLKNSSMGQALGGYAQSFENAINALPFSGVAPKIEQGVKGLRNQIANRQAEIKGGTQEAVEGLKKGLYGAKEKLNEDLIARQTAKSKLLDEDIAKLADPLKAEEADFSRKMVNEAIKPTGITLKPNVTGKNAIIAAQKIEDDLYKKAIPKIADEFGDVEITDVAQSALKKVLENNKSRLGNSEYYGRLQDDIDNIIARGGETGRVTAQQWHDIFKDLGKEAFDNKKPLVQGTQREYGNALTQLKNEWMKIIEDTPGGDIIKTANKVHSAIQVPQAAAARLESFLEGGTFDPKQFLRELQKESSTKRFAAGDAKMQEEAFQAYKSIAEKRGALKTQADDLKEAAKQTQKQEKKEVGKTIGQQAENLAKQRAYLKSQSEQQSKGLTELGKEVTPEPFASYGAKRMGYDVAGASLVTGGGGLLSHLFGVSPALQAMISGGTLSATNALYSKPVQDFIKSFAVKERPEIIKQLGKELREYSPAGAMVAADEYQNLRQQGQPEYTFEEPTQTGGAPVPK
jgi:hypothetical protein